MNVNGNRDAAIAGIKAVLDLIHPEQHDGTVDTPKRFVKAYEEMTSGYAIDTDAILTTTFDAEGFDEIILVKDIPFTSLCEHHMLPFTGSVAVAYIPSGGRIVGLSKIPRVVQAFARRLQVQERITTQVADALQKNLDPQAVAVVIEGQHSCMSCRGVRSSGSMVTSVMRGRFRDEPAARQELGFLLRSS